MLTVKNVTKKYGKFTALEGINIEFTKGIYGLLAPNGAGKTSLIKMLTMLSVPNNGEILWNNSNIIGLDKSYRDIVGYLPQDFGYYNNFTPRDFLYYIATLKGLDSDTKKRRTDNLLELFGLNDVKNKKMGKLSGGMIRRVGIAQAMLNNPKILILDEPTAGLDPKERVHFRNYISSLSKDRIIILSTHIVSDIETIATYVIMLKNRKILVNSAPDKLCAQLTGKIYETDDMTTVDTPHLILTERQEGVKTYVKFACEANVPSLKPVRPNMEDVFLYVYSNGTV